MKLIPLTQGKFAQVDDSDFAHLSQWKWSAGLFSTKWYAVRGTSERVSKGVYTHTSYLMHRQLMGFPKGVKIDHKDGDSLNNQRDNIRAATTSQNGQNRSGPTRVSTSGILGVFKRKDCNRWAAHIRVNGKLNNLGLFITKEEAVAARIAAEKLYYGEFAPKRL